MPFITKDGLNKRLTDLERRVCCHKTLFYDNLAAFPVEGKVETLYVDESTGAVYIWGGSEYITFPGPVHTNQTSVTTYTGTQLPSTAGVTVGDTTTVKFVNGFFGDFTWDGAIWVKNNDDYHSKLRLEIIPPVDLNFTSVGSKDFVIKVSEYGGKTATGDLIIYIAPNSNILTTSFDSAKVYADNPVMSVLNHLTVGATFVASGSGGAYIFTIPSHTIGAYSEHYFAFTLTTTAVRNATYGLSLQIIPGGEMGAVSRGATVGQTVTVDSF